MGSLENLRSWPDLEATEHQLACLDAAIEHGSPSKAARALGVSRSTVRSALNRLKLKAAVAGFSPDHDMVHTVPAGFNVKGVSTYYGQDGEVRGQWVKSQADRDARTAAMMEACRDFAEQFHGAADPIPPPAQADEDLLVIYPIADIHLGLYCWARETGVDWDLATAKRVLSAAIDYLVDHAPPAKHALIVNLGDFYHSDNPSNRTTASGNPLDVDTRWAKVLRTGIRAQRHAIDRALEKHAHVTVINSIGNHDADTAVMLSAVMSETFADEPRVTIDDSPRHHHYYRFGKCLFGVTHGHTAKGGSLAEVMAADRKEDWGETNYRVWLTGHIHHDTKKDLRGCTIESFRTLAPGDAWHNAQGYRSMRDMKCIVYDRELGECERYRFGIERFAK